MLLSRSLGPLGGFALFIVSICGPVSRPRGWRRGHRNAWKQRCQEKKKRGGVTVFCDSLWYYSVVYSDIFYEWLCSVCYDGLTGNADRESPWEPTGHTLTLLVWQKAAIQELASYANTSIKLGLWFPDQPAHFTGEKKAINAMCLVLKLHLLLSWCSIVEAYFHLSSDVTLNLWQVGIEGN